MDGAILFSDILMLPYALGQKLAFHEGEGPVLERIEDPAGVARLDPGRVGSSLDPVFETARRVRDALDARTTLIGFAGAPWTVATYMVEGGGSRDFRRVKSWAYRDPQGFNALIDLLAEATIEYLTGQIEAGAEVVQLFDSWAGILPEPAFVRWVIEPTRRIVSSAETSVLPIIRSSVFPAAPAYCMSAIFARRELTGSASIRRCRSAMRIELCSRTGRFRAISIPSC